VGLWSIGLAFLKGTGWWSGDLVCLWIASLAGFKGTVPAEIMQARAGVNDAVQWRSWRPVEA
jgi:hypothetical protein